MSDDNPIGPDRVPGAPHPRNTPHLIGQEEAERAFLESFGAGRLHHGWLITGQKGSGKATLAYRIARFLLATPDPDADGGLFGAPETPQSLDVPAEHPVATRIAAGSEPGLRSVTRTSDDNGKLRARIVVDDIRALAPFFQLSATEGGRRVVIVDSADDMNTNAANALLKMLEEPPARTTLLLLSHQPSRLLPTIRSRCRTLALRPLEAGQMAEALAQAGTDPVKDAAALAELSAGSVGAALRLLNQDGLQLYEEIISILGTLPLLDRTRTLALAEAAAQRGAEERLDLIIALLDVALTRLARAGATGQLPLVEAAPQEAAIFARLAPTPQAGRSWAEVAGVTLARARHGIAVNLDPAALVLDIFLKLNATATRAAA